MIDEEWSGNFRDGNVSITNSLHMPPKFHLVYEELEKSIKRFNESKKTRYMVIEKIL